MKRKMNHLVAIIALFVATICYSQPIDGIDVSHHQGKINWTELKKNNKSIKFVYIKCTEGASYTDSKCAEYYKGAKAAGFHVGVYHYFRMTSTPSAQFKNFKKHIKASRSDLIPMVDVEQADGYTSAQVKAKLQEFLNLIEKEYGVKPMIYGTNSSYNKYCAPKFNNYPLYIGRYGKNAPQIANAKYTIWQYSDKTKLKGIEKAVDVCKFGKGKDINDILMK